MTGVQTCALPIYTSYHYYAFSGTNLLTRCHSASSCFLLFLVSEKLFWKYSRNWTKQNPRCLFFPTRSRSPKERRRGAPRRPHHVVARVPPLAHRHVVRSPRASTDIAHSPINCRFRENPKHVSLHPQKVPEPPPSSTLAREGSEALPGTLPERGIITGGLYIAMPSSGVMCE